MATASNATSGGTGLRPAAIVTTAVDPCQVIEQELYDFVQRVVAAPYRAFARDIVRGNLHAVEAAGREQAASFEDVVPSGSPSIGSNVRAFRAPDAATDDRLWRIRLQNAEHLYKRNLRIDNDSSAGVLYYVGAASGYQRQLALHLWAVDVAAIAGAVYERAGPRCAARREAVATVEVFLRQFDSVPDARFAGYEIKTAFKVLDAERNDDNDGFERYTYEAAAYRIWRSRNP